VDKAAVIAIVLRTDSAVGFQPTDWETSDCLYDRISLRTKAICTQLVQMSPGNVYNQLRFW
jgi:hypothetical protein